MRRLITGRARNRLVTYGMLTLLFVAGLAFSVLENTAGSRAMLSLGIGEDDEMLAVPTDPRLDPNDCQYDPTLLKELTARPHAGEKVGKTDAELPPVHPTPPPSSSQVGDESPDTTSPGTMPSESPETPSGDTPATGKNPPSGDTPGSGQDPPSKPPHTWAGESDCPAR